MPPFFIMQSKESQSLVTPQAALQMLKDGNKRFVEKISWRGIIIMKRVRLPLRNIHLRLFLDALIPGCRLKSYSTRDLGIYL